MNELIVSKTIANMCFTTSMIKRSAAESKV